MVDVWHYSKRCLTHISLAAGVWMKQKIVPKVKKGREDKKEMKRKMLLFPWVKVSVMLLGEVPGLGRLISHTNTFTQTHNIVYQNITLPLVRNLIAEVAACSDVKWEG